MSDKFVFVCMNSTPDPVAAFYDNDKAIDFMNRQNEKYSQQFPIWQEYAKKIKSANPWDDPKFANKYQEPISGSYPENIVELLDADPRWIEYQKLIKEQESLCKDYFLGYIQAIVKIPIIEYLD